MRVTHPGGWPLVDAPVAPAWTGPALGPTDARLAADGIELHGDTATPSWQGGPLDLGFTMHLLYPSAGTAPGDVPAGTPCKNDQTRGRIGDRPRRAHALH